MAFKTSKPFLIGIVTSNRTMSGSSLKKRSRPTSPSDAVSTRASSHCSWMPISRASRKRASSSTTSTFMGSPRGRQAELANGGRFGNRCEQTANLPEQRHWFVRGSVHVRRQVAYAAQCAKVRLVCWRPRQQHRYVRVRQSRVERQVVTLTLRIERGEPRIVDHQVRAFGERAIPYVT